MKKLSALWISSMPTAESSPPIACSGMDRALTMVWSTWPSTSMTWMARANPISRAVPVNSAAPIVNCLAMSSNDMRDTKPTATARATNTAPSSTRYQPCRVIPTMSSNNVASVSHSTACCRALNRDSSGDAGGCASGMSATSDAE